MTSTPRRWLAPALSTITLITSIASAQTPLQAAENVDTSTARQLSSAFRAAADDALPAVVFIRVEKEPTPRMQQRMPENIPEPFRFFFEQPRQQPDAPPFESGAGSGFIVERDGRIVTNAHVVADANYILVRLWDGREYEAELVGADRSSDVAVIQIQPGEGPPLPVAALGDSDDVRVGDWVLALGSPLGLDFTVTAGIVSAKGRGRLGGADNALESYIQTDAAINPGNSGGPLVDLDGRVVGINTAIFGGGSRFVGYGFAIPIDLATRVVGDLVEFGFVRRPRLGIRVGDVSAVDAEVYGLPAVRGAEVAAVEAGSPAAEVGLQPGDVILQVAGQEIRDATDLTARLARRRPGERVELTVFRNRERQQLTVELGEFDRPEPRDEREDARRAVEEVLGFQARAITPDLVRQFELEESDGLVVTEVNRYSAAAAAGVRPGQVLLSVNGRSVTGMAELEDVAEQIQPGDAVSLRVRLPEIGETVINFRVRR